MKDKVIGKLRSYRKRIQDLRSSVSALKTDGVAKLSIRKEAEQVATQWVEELRSPLEHFFKLPAETIEEMSLLVKRLHVLSRPNNKKSSYKTCLDGMLKEFENRFILPIQQMSSDPTDIGNLSKIVAKIPQEEYSDYLHEAIQCAQIGKHRAAIVMGWCAAIARIRSAVLARGLAKFNAASLIVKAQTTGKYKRWNKSFALASDAELEAVFDTDLIVVCEAMGFFDSNQSSRLEVDFQYRNHSAHPGDAPIAEPHVVSFFTDIVEIVLLNTKLS